MEINTLTNTLRDFVETLADGSARLTPYALGLLGALMIIDIALTGSMTALGEYGVAQLAKRVLILGGWTYLTMEFHTLAAEFMDSLVMAGQIAGGRAPRENFLMDPSHLAGLGLEASAPMLAMAQNAGALTVGSILGGGTAGALLMVAIFLLGWLVLLVAYFVLAIVVFLAVLEYHVTLTVVGLLIPFGATGWTRFISERSLGALVGSGIKLMSLSLAISVMGPVLATGINRMVANAKAAGGVITVNALVGLALTSIAVAAFAYLAPKAASSLGAGAAASLGGLGDLSRGASQAAGAVGTVGNVATGGAGAALAATKVATTAVAGAGKGLAYTAGAMSSGAKMGAAMASGGALSRFAGGAAGAVRGGAAAVAGGVAQAFKGKASISPGKPPSAFARGAAQAAPKGATPPASAPAESTASTWSATTGGYVSEPPPKAALGAGATPIVIGSQPGPHVASKTGSPLPPPSPAVSSGPVAGRTFDPAPGSLQNMTAQPRPTAAPAVAPPPPPLVSAPPSPAVISPPSWAANASAHTRLPGKKPPTA